MLFTLVVGVAKKLIINLVNLEEMRSEVRKRFKVSKREELETKQRLLSRARIG